ncbi:MAG: hypothetical protein MI923_23025 [Phycisphaerales bacterium]|nr:hypothetical protein [Phycisphaerales bacterium]
MRRQFLLLVTAVSLSNGCDVRSTLPESAEASASSEAVSRSRSPAEVVDQLNDYHQKRDYKRIAPLVVAERRLATVDFLKAVDRVIDRNLMLREIAEMRYGGPMSDAWDLTAIGNNLGVFSNRIKVINQRFKGETAIVTLQEGDNVPLVRATFDLTNEGWQLRPVLPPKSAVPELGKLADILVDLTQAMEQGLAFEGYFKAFVDRVLPQMQKVAVAKDGA